MWPRPLPVGADDGEWPQLGAAAAAAPDSAAPAAAAAAALQSCAEVKFALLDRLPAFERPVLPADLRSRGAPVPLWSAAAAARQQRDAPSHWRHWQQQQDAGWRWETLLTDAPELSSFSIAGRSVDCLDGVDVISEGSNIKKLLKLAYNTQEEISMMVHRVGRPLLLDEFDITKHLLETEATEWVWLDRLLREHFLTKFEDADWARRATAQEEAEAVNSRSAALYWELLQRSVPALPPLAQVRPTAAAPLLALPAPDHQLRAPPAPPAPPTPGARHRTRCFTRNMLWTFQDLKMLIGTEMPILGGGTHPCVSLRLHNMAEPINVLTGLDYWLDNLMSNVPEVLMCYHVDGVLKECSLMRTEELPRLEGSAFEPRVVHDVAENILTFLTKNATKTGHTYWLFKGEDDDCVKLYDLSSLLEEHFENVSRDANPFTAHVALLLYRMACNMLRNRHVVDYGDRLGTVRTILDKTLQLIDSDQYLQVRANIHMMLADCYVPRDHRPLATQFGGPATGEAAAAPLSPHRQPLPAGAGGDTSPWTQQPMVRVQLLSMKGAVRAPAVDSLGAGSGHDLRPRPIRGDAQQRTEQALQHVLHALSCLRRQETLQQQEHEETPRMARPRQPIPMPYCPLSALPETGPQPGPEGPEASSEEPEPSTGKAEPSARPPEPPSSAESEWGDVTERLLLQKSAHLCTVRAAAHAQQEHSMPALQAAHVALCCVRAAGGGQQVPEVTAAASVLVSDALLTLSRPCHSARLARVRRDWRARHEHIIGQLVDALTASAAYEPPSFVQRPDLDTFFKREAGPKVKTGPTAASERGNSTETASERGVCATTGSESGAGENSATDRGAVGETVSEAGAASGTASKADTDSGTVFDLRENPCQQTRRQLLQDSVKLLETALELEMTAQMRLHVRERLGLVWNELGLMYSGRLEAALRLVRSLSKEPQRRAAQTEQLRAPVNAAKRGAFNAFSKAGGLLRGEQRAVTEMNMGHLHDRVAAVQHGLWAAVPVALEALHRAGEAYGRAAAVAAASQHTQQRSATALGCADFGGRMALLRSRVACRMAELHRRMPAAPGDGVGSASDLQLMRRALALCDPSAPLSASERRLVCCHAGTVLTRLAQLASGTRHHHYQQRGGGGGAGRGKAREQQVHEALELHSRASHMYRQAGRPDLLIGALCEQAILSDSLAVECGQWRGRLRLVEGALVTAAAAAPIAPLLGQAQPEEVALAERRAERLLTSLLNGLRTICTLHRKHGAPTAAGKRGRKAATTGCDYDEVYRRALSAVQQQQAAVHRLDALLTQISNGRRRRGQPSTSGGAHSGATAAATGTGKRANGAAAAAAAGNCSANSACAGKHRRQPATATVSEGQNDAAGELEGADAIASTLGRDCSLAERAGKDSSDDSTEQPERLPTPATLHTTNASDGQRTASKGPATKEQKSNSKRAAGAALQRKGKEEPSSETEQR